MFDAALRPLIDPPLNRAAAVLAGRGVSADVVSLTGAALAVVAAALVASGLFHLALLPLLASRLADGLDGPIARISGGSSFGGYLDLLCDIIFYAVIPLGFVLVDPAQNAVAGAILLGAFYLNIAGFLGFAVLAEKAGLTTEAQGKKAFFYAGGLLEGGETIAFFVLLCLWPGVFALAALIFAALCVVTTLGRLWRARALFRG